MDGHRPDVTRTYPELVSLCAGAVVTKPQTFRARVQFPPRSLGALRRAVTQHPVYLQGRHVTASVDDS